MTTKVFDTFTGTNGTDLSAHTPDTDVVGGGWTDSGVNDFELDGAGAAKASAAGDTSWISAGTPTQRVSTNWTAGGADNRMSIFARFDGNLASPTAYVFNIRPNASTIQLSKVVAGTTTALGTNSSYTMSVSSTYLIELEVIGTAIKAYIDSVEEFSVTDSAISTGNYGAIKHELRTNANARFNDFTIDDTLSGAAPLYFNHLMKMHNG